MPYSLGSQVLPCWEIRTIQMVPRSFARPTPNRLELVRVGALLDRLLPAATERLAPLLLKTPVSSKAFACGPISQPSQFLESHDITTGVWMALGVPGCSRQLRGGS